MGEKEGGEYSIVYIYSVHANMHKHKHRQRHSQYQKKTRRQEEKERFGERRTVDELSGAMLHCIVCCLLSAACCEPYCCGAMAQHIYQAQPVAVYCTTLYYITLWHRIAVYCSLLQCCIIALLLPYCCTHIVVMRLFLDHVPRMPQLARDEGGVAEEHEGGIGSIAHHVQSHLLVVCCFLR